MAPFDHSATIRVFREIPVTAAAYTLIEVVIVLLVVGILAAAAAPKYATALTERRLEAVTLRIGADIKHARRNAQQTSSTQSIVFNVATNSYSLAGVNDIDRRGQNYQFFLGQSEYECQLVAVNFGGSTTLNFDVFGRVQTSGTITVRCGSSTRILTVNALGQVTGS